MLLSEITGAGAIAGVTGALFATPIRRPKIKKKRRKKLKEKFLDMYKDFGDTIQIFIDPDYNEYKEAFLDTVDYVRAILKSDGSVITWIPQTVFHDNIAEHLKLKGDSMSVYIQAPLGANSATVYVAISNEKRHLTRNDETIEWIDSHKGFKRMFPEGTNKVIFVND